jgi:predicted ester cyclase
MSTEENKAIVVRHLKEVGEQGRVDLIDSYYAPDGASPDMDTPEQWKDRVLWFHKTCPGFKFTILDLMAEGDKVMCHVQVDLTYSVPDDPPPALFPPLGKPVSWRNFDVYRIVSGKLVSRQNILGWTDMLVEIGVNPMPKTAANKAAVRKFCDALNRQDAALLAEVCSPEVAKVWTEEWLPDLGRDHLHIELGDMAADDEMVAAKMVTAGDHNTATYSLPPSGKHWTNRVFGFFRFAEGKIVEFEWLDDVENIIKQIGGAIQPVAA